MANPQNLKPFGPNNPPPPNRGRKKGSRNRATVLREWLSKQVTLRNPITGENEKKDLEHEVVLAWIAKARKGDMVAIRELFDTLYGKIPNTINLNVDELDAEIESRLARLATGSESSVFGEAESEAAN